MKRSLNRQFLLSVIGSVLSSALLVAVATAAFV